MAATVWVHGLTARKFAMGVPVGSTVQAFKSGLWADPVTTGSWAVYLADEGGARTADAAPLDEADPFPAAAGATVHVKVERVEPASAAGEPWGAWGSFGRLASFSHSPSSPRPHSVLQQRPCCHRLLVVVLPLLPLEPLVAFLVAALPTLLPLWFSRHVIALSGCWRMPLCVFPSLT
jgi:hypothetical protein